MTTDGHSPFVPVAALCAAGLVAAALVVADTDFERTLAPPRSVVVVQAPPEIQSLPPATGLVRAPPPRRVVVVRRRTRAS